LYDRTLISTVATLTLVRCYRWKSSNFCRTAFHTQSYSNDFFSLEL